MPQEYRDGYSQAKIFVPTQEEKQLMWSMKEVEEKNKALDEKMAKLDKILDRYESRSNN